MIKDFIIWIFPHNRVMKELILLTEIRESIPNLFYYKRNLRFIIHYDKELEEVCFRFPYPLFKLPIDTIRIVDCFQGFRYECWRGKKEWTPSQRFLLEDLFHQLMDWQLIYKDLLQNRFHPKNYSKFIDWGWETPISDSS